MLLKEVDELASASDGKYCILPYDETSLVKSFKAVTTIRCSSIV